MPIPVILDTDIGLDVDDVWALAFFTTMSRVRDKANYHLYRRYDV